MVVVRFTKRCIRIEKRPYWENEDAVFKEFIRRVKPMLERRKELLPQTKELEEEIRALCKEFSISAVDR